MSEQKRVPTQTLELASSLGNATKKEKKGEKGKQLAPSFRLELSLDDKNEKGYSECVYAHLLKAAEKKRGKEVKSTDENVVNGLDPFDDDDDNKLKEMAKRFEAKYGTTTIGKNRKNHDDDVDLGAGYDESDSFIDNTDAYDEVVPEGVTTAHGGFYINSGPLEFSVNAADPNSLTHRINNNNDDDSSESCDDEAEDSNSPDSKRRHRDALISSSEDDDTEDIVGAPALKKSKYDENGEKKSNYDIVKKKKKLLSDQAALESLNKLKIVDDKPVSMEVEGILENPEEKKKFPSDIIPRSKDKKFDIKKFVKKPTTNGIEEKKIDVKKTINKDSNIDDAIESVVNDGKVEDESSRDTIDSGKSRCIAGTSSECEDIDKVDIPSPDLIPEDIRDIINKLKKHAENNKEGKIKFFDSIVNSMLLSLEKKLRILDSPAVRMQVYGHLAHFLNCSKTTLANRAKKLCLQDAESRVKEPIQRLKVIIDGTMPSVMESYMKECQRVADIKNFEASHSGDSSDGNEKIADKSKLPRKRFPWTSEARKLVCEIATAWRQYFRIRKPRKESMESFVESYLKSKILPLWPSGWMKLDALLKYANFEPTAQKKSKKPRDSALPSNSIALTNMSNSSTQLEITNVSNLPATQEILKSSTNSGKGNSDTNPVNYTQSLHSGKSTDLTIEKRPNSFKQKEKIRDNLTVSTSQHENLCSSAPMAKISLVPTSQLMAQKPTSKCHIDKFNPMDLTSSSLSITPVNEFQKVNKSLDEVKKDVVSITPYADSSSNIINDTFINRSDVFSMSNQSSGLKPVSLKQRILQENAENKIDKRSTDSEAQSSESKERKRDRWLDDKYKCHDAKKRKKEQKIFDQSQQVISLKSEVSSVIQQPTLSKEEQEQRQIEETMAATNFLSQIINDDLPRTTNERRKDPSTILDENISNIQPSEQEKDVQMVMRSLKELQELQEMKFSPNHSPLQKTKSTHQYTNYSDDYQRLYQKKDDKLRLPKDEPQW